MTAMPPPPAADTRAAARGWAASLKIGFERRAGRTALTERRQRGPLAVQRPFHPEGEPCHCYLLHPPGGLVGGDRLAIGVAVGAGAHALITSPGAAKFYRSAGSPAVQHQRLEVAAGGTLEWLPQENILFRGALACTATEVDLTGDARYLGWEIHCLGRPAIGERLGEGAADLSLRLSRDGRPLLRDRLRLRAQDLDGPSGLRGQPVLATLLATGAEGGDLAAARAAACVGAGYLAATLVEDLLIARYLGPSGEAARAALVSIWKALRPRLIGPAPCPPRIWAT